jgi:urease accessory protein
LRSDSPSSTAKPAFRGASTTARWWCRKRFIRKARSSAGGDELTLELDAGDGAQALLTTPGAGKWYRSNGAWARQGIAIDLAKGALLEWLPQETIVFDGALASFSTEVRLAQDARYLGWEIFCLGRTGSGESYARGECRFSTRVCRDGRPLWLERGRIDGGGRLLQSPAGLAAQPVFGTLAAAFPGAGKAHVDACREQAPEQGEGAVTLLPGILIARYLGASTEAARRYFTALWSVLRPGLAGRAAAEPRIWRT